MRILIKILAIGVLLTNLATELSAQQDSPLRRLTLRSDIFGWEAVGRLDIDNKGYCTGVLLRPDIVMTAAHCLFEHDQGKYKEPKSIIFRAGLRDGNSVADRAALRAVVHRKYRTSNGDERNNTRYDVGLLQLAKPIPAAIAAPFKVQSFSGLGRKVSVVSYARGRDKTLSWQRSCGVRARQNGLIAFSCDVDFGSSGAPVFNLSAGGARIVSIISGGNREGGKVVSIGMELPDIVDELIADLHSGRGAYPGTSTTSKRLRVGEGAKDIGARFLRP